MDYNELFQDTSSRILADAIKAASVNRTIPTEPAISEKLPADKTDLIFSFHADHALPLSCIEEEAERFLAGAKSQAIKNTLGDAYEALISKPDHAESVSEHVRAALDSIASGGESFSEKLASCLYKPETNLIRPAPRFSIGSITVCTAGNLATISAPAKQGKTAAMSAMIAATFATNEADCLGFGSSNPQGHAVIHIDPEQSPFDHWELLNLTQRRAGRPLPPWVRSFCLTGFNADDIRRAIPVLMEQAQKQFGGIHSVLLDGSADCVHDVNDPAEANGFVAELHALAIKFDCPIVCAIHLNPGSDFKTRGHLGSQLERKAETNLKIEKLDEASVIWAEKNRHAPILKSTAPRFAWSNEAGMHISIESQQDAKADVEFNTMTELFKKAFTNRPSMTYTDLTAATVSAIKTTDKKHLSVDPRTAQRKIARADTLGVIKKTFAGLYEIRG